MTDSSDCLCRKLTSGETRINRTCVLDALDQPGGGTTRRQWCWLYTRVQRRTSRIKFSTVSWYLLPPLLSLEDSSLTLFLASSKRASRCSARARRTCRRE